MSDEEPVVKREATSGEDSSSSSTTSSDSDSSSATSITDVTELYEVSEIVAHRRVGRLLQYRIRWDKCGPEEDTWEPEENLVGGITKIILRQYKEKHKLDKPAPALARGRKRKNDADKPGSSKRGRKKKQESSEESTTSGSDSEAEAKDNKKDEPKKKAIGRKKKVIEPKKEVIELDSDSEEDLNTTENSGWYGVKADESNRSLKGLFVPDRKLDEREQFLSAVQGDGGRMTRNKVSAMLNTSASPASSSGAAKSHRRTGVGEDDVFTLDSGTSTPVKTKASPKKKGTPSKSTTTVTSAAVKAEEDDETETQLKERKHERQRIREKIQEDARKKEEKKNQREKEKEERLAKKDKKRAEKKEKREKSHKRSKHRERQEESSTSLVTDRTRDEATAPVSKPPQFFRSYKIPKSEKVKKKREKSPDRYHRSYGISTKNLTLDIVSISSQNLNKNQPQFHGPLTLTETNQQKFEDDIMNHRVAEVRAALANKEHGLDVNSVHPDGKTLLHRIVERPCDPEHHLDEMLDILVNNGADMTLGEIKKNYTPLHLAVYCRRYCHVTKLLKLKAPINIVDNYDENVMVAATRSMAFDFVREILYRGGHYHTCFNPGTGLNKTQVRLLTVYGDRLQSALDEMKTRLFRNATKMANHTIVFQTPLCDGTEVKIKFNPIPDPLVEKHNEERFNFVSMCLCNFERGILKCSVSRDSPVTSMLLNDIRLDVVNPRNRYVFAIKNQLHKEDNELTIRYEKNPKTNLLLLIQICSYIAPDITRNPRVIDVQMADISVEPPVIPAALMHL